MVDRRDFLKGGAGLLGLGGLGAFLAWENQQDNLDNDAVNRRQNDRINDKVDRSDIQLPEDDTFPIPGYTDDQGIGFDQVRRINRQLQQNLERQRKEKKDIDDVTEIEDILSSGSDVRVGEKDVSPSRDQFSTGTTGALPRSDEFVRDAEYILSTTDEKDIIRQNDRGEGVRRTNFTTFGATEGIQTGVDTETVIDEYGLVESDAEAISSALDDVSGLNVFARLDQDEGGLVNADPDALGRAADKVERERKDLVQLYDELTAKESGYAEASGLLRDLSNSLEDARYRAGRANDQADKKGVDRNFTVEKEETTQTILNNVEAVAESYQGLVNGVASSIARLDVTERTLENGSEVAREIQSNAGVDTADSYKEALPGQNAEDGCDYAFNAVAEDLEENKGVSPSEIEQAFFQSNSSLRVRTEEGDFTYDTC